MKKLAQYALLLPLFALLSACGGDAESSSTRTDSNPAGTYSASSAAVQQTPAKEPVFVKEGELSFRNPDGKKVIHRLDIELAETSEERQQGLMYRKSMQDGQGMLFVFETEEPQAFWMRNTYIPLDIIYVNSKFQVVSIQKNCKILNDTPLPSGAAAQYVVEINGGLSDKLGIKTGSVIEWQNLLTGQHFGESLF